MPDYTFNVTTNQYEIGGSPVSLDEILGKSELFLSSSKEAAAVFSTQMIDGDKTPGVWLSDMREEIKRSHIRQYILAAGGREQMTAADWGSIGGMVGSQYRPYLQGFYDQIVAGELTPGQILERTEMYINSAREAFNRSFQRTAEKAGATEERWVLGPLDHCDDCLDNDALGWVPIGTLSFPGDGNTQCLTNCGCWKEYRRADGSKVWQ